MNMMRVQALALLLCSVVTSSKARKNVLFLMSDDMRPQLGAYEGKDFPSPVHPSMHTPNLDALAKRSLLFKRAYVQQAVCNPSRTSALTGRRPDTTHVYDIVTYWRSVGGNYTTIPEYFKQNGYTTAGMGKIFHPGAASGSDDPQSWTEPYYHAHETHYDYIPRVTWYSVNRTHWEKYPLQDMLIANHTIKTLRKLAPAARNGDKPFFIAAGFHRPHLPWIVPDKFFDYYPEESVKVPDNQYAPVDMPPLAWSDFDELRLWKDVGTKYGYGAINTTLPGQFVRDLRRAYYAAVSYVDSLIGEIIAELEALGLAESTIISFWGDHGYQLGEHGEWCKHTDFELSTHVPFMLRVPGVTDAGMETRALVEMVDLFPTLAEATGLPPISMCPQKDAPKVSTCTEGISLMPLTTNSTLPWKKAAFSQYPRMAVDGNIYMGYTMRTDRYRYTEWAQFHYATYTHKWGDIFHKIGYELYDHELDPEENWNRAFDNSYKEIKKSLSGMLHAGWRKALPTNPLVEMQ